MPLISASQAIIAEALYNKVNTALISPLVPLSGFLLFELGVFGWHLLPIGATEAEVTDHGRQLVQLVRQRENNCKLHLTNHKSRLVKQVKQHRSLYLQGCVIASYYLDLSGGRVGLLHSVKVNSHSKGNGNLICPGVATANRATWVIYFVGHI